MSFFEVQFPVTISADAVGGPSRLTDIVTLRSGFEEANSIWKHSRRRWEASTGIRTYDDLHAVLTFWEVMSGQLHQFRWKDWSDFKSCAPSATPTPLDQAIGEGDGERVSFQLVKNYVVGSAAYARPIRKPVAGTVRVALDGVEQDVGTDVVVDATTGIVAFVTPPAMGQAVSAGFAFDVPARFASDTLSTHLEHYQLGSASIEIIEVRT